MARKTRDSSIATPIENQLHHSLAKLNRNLLFVSISVPSVFVNVTDESKSDEMNTIIALHCEDFSLSIHQRQNDARISFRLDRALFESPLGTDIQCGFLDENAFAKQFNVDEQSFVSMVVELQKRTKSKTSESSKVKLKLNVGPIEVLGHSLLNTISNLQSLQVVDSNLNPTDLQPESDVMMKIARAIMGSNADMAAIKGHQSRDFDLNFNSLYICFDSGWNASKVKNADAVPYNKASSFSILSLVDINIRFARRPCRILKTCGQLDFRVTDVQLHDLSRVRVLY